MRISQDIRDEFGTGSAATADPRAAVAAGMRAKSSEFLASGGKVYLPAPSVGRPATG
jgi:phosphomethylpyrimidine synthase